MWLIAIRLLPDLIQILMSPGEKKMVFLSGKEIARQNIGPEMNFRWEESSLSGRNFWQGLFSSGEIIPERKKFFAGIIFQWRNHP